MIRRGPPLPQSPPPTHACPAPLLHSRRPPSESGSTPSPGLIPRLGLGCSLKPDALPILRASAQVSFPAEAFPDRSKRSLLLTPTPGASPWWPLLACTAAQHSSCLRETPVPPKGCCAAGIRPTVFNEAPRPGWWLMPS